MRETLNFDICVIFRFVGAEFVIEKKRIKTAGAGD